MTEPTSRLSFPIFPSALKLFNHTLIGITLSNLPTPRQPVAIAVREREEGRAVHVVKEVQLSNPRTYKKNVKEAQGFQTVKNQTSYASNPERGLGWSLVLV